MSAYAPPSPEGTNDVPRHLFKRFPKRLEHLDVSVVRPEAALAMSSDI